MTTPATFRRRPAEIEAVQWTGDNADALRAFAGHDFTTIDPEDRIDDPAQDAQVLVEASHWVGMRPTDWVVKYEGYFVVKADETFRTVWEPTSPAYVRLQTAAKEATEAAHLHAMHGMKRVFQLARRYGTAPIPAAEVLEALGLDENANTIEPPDEPPAGVYEQLADRLDAEHARRSKAAWSPEEATAAREWGNVADFVRALSRSEAGRG